MFCQNCGKQLPDGAKFCDGCGTKVPDVSAPVAEQPVVETPAVEAPVSEPPVQEAPVEVAPIEVAPEFPSEVALGDMAFAAPVFEEPEAPKKKCKWWKPLVFIGVPVLAIAALLVTMWHPIIGFFIKTFGPDEAYLHHVEGKVVEDTVDSVTEGYDSLLSALKETPEISENVTMSVNLSDDILSMVEQFVFGGDTEMDLSWINDAEIAFNVAQDGNRTKLDATIGLGDDKVVSAEAIMDMAEGKVYVSVPELSDKYIALDLNEVTGGASVSGMLADMLSSGELQEAIVNILPDSKTLGRLLNKYGDVILKSIEDVEESSETFEIEGIEKKVTVLEYDVDDKLLLTIAENVLEAAKDDEDIVTILENAEDVVADLMGDRMPAELDLADMVDEAIDMALDSIDDVDTTGDTLATVYTYVDGSSEVIGRAVEVEDMMVFSYLTLTKGKKEATEIIIAEQLVLAGSGETKKNLFNGTYTVEFDGTALVELEVKDYDVKKAEDGYLNGTFRLTPTDEVYDLIGMGAGEALSMVDLGLEISVKSDENTASLTVNILNGSEVYAGVTLAATGTELKAVSTPSEDKIADVDEWAQSIDPSAFMQSLPSELTELLGSMGGSRVESDMAEVSYR